MDVKSKLECILANQSKFTTIMTEKHKNIKYSLQLFTEVDDVSGVEFFS